MEHLKRDLSDEEQANELINTIVAEAGDGISGYELGSKLISSAETYLTVEVQRHVYEYVAGIRNKTRYAVIEALEPGVGGVYNGNVAIAKATLQISTSIYDTLARVEEVANHERWHADHRHLDPLIRGDAASDGDIVVIAGEGFTETELIEGWTVRNTGHEFVSDEYRVFEDRLTRAMHRAGLNDRDISLAIDQQKDLRRIDDATRPQLA